MRLIDLTHTITEIMPVYPGTDEPKLKKVNTIQVDGYNETLLTMYSHTGTHMDAPSHLFKDAPSLDTMDVSAFMGKGLVIDCSDLGEGQRITMDRIHRVKEMADEADFLLFHTGWDRLWGTDAYFDDYPCITEEVGRYMIDSGKKGIGLDVISVDPVSSHYLPLHKAILGTGNMVIIENLTALDRIGKDIFTFMALPLKYHRADGAPIRAVAWLD